MRSISIIGVGRMGGALALALSEKKYRIENLIARSSENARKIIAAINQKTRFSTLEEIANIDSEIILICTQDAEIAATAALLPEKIKNGAAVFHTSGALSSEILAKVRENGNETGSIHPLVSISDSFLGANRFENAYFAVEGTSESCRIAESLVVDLGGKPFSIDTKYKTLYHAAAVTACGHLVAVVETAIEMLAGCGLENREAQRILLPLIESTIENLRTQTPAEALTGTFARADDETFAKHTEIISRRTAPDILEIYLLLGEKSLALAEKKGADSARIEKIRRGIVMAKKHLR